MSIEQTSLSVNDAVRDTRDATLSITETLTSILSDFAITSIEFLFKLIGAYIIWLIGKFFINKFAAFVRRMDIKRFSFDDSIREVVLRYAIPAFKVILFLVILDTFEIGSGIISAIFQGLTFTISIALGFAAAKALEPYAVDIANRFLSRDNKRPHNV